MSEADHEATPGRAAPSDEDRDRRDREAARQAARHLRRLKKREMAAAEDPASGVDLDPALARRAALDYRTTTSGPSLLTKALQAGTPGLRTLQHYRRSWLKSDVFAGIAVVAYMIPQCMAYSAIVGVPPQIGLSTALGALVVYAVMGQSRMLSVGPESTVALIAGVAIAPFAEGDAVKATALGAALSLIVAFWCFVARMLRLGIVAELLSQPLLVGYLLGAAVLMVVGQLGKMTGTKVHGESIVEQFQSFLSVVANTHWLTLWVGLGTFAFLMIIHWVRHRWPATLIAVIAATIVCTVLQLKNQGVAVLGTVPTGLPMPTFPAMSWSEIESLLPAGVGVAIVAYGDNTLVARGFPAPIEPDEDRSVNQLDPQQELIALGGCHVAVGLIGGFPVSSSGSRTALAVAAGARTQMYSLVAAAMLVIVLFVAGPLIANLPQAALAAVVFYAATKLVNIAELKRLARFRKRELLLALSATIGTVLFGVVTGIGIAIALSVLEMTQRLARPHDGVLGRVPGLPGMHDVKDYPTAQTIPGLIVYRYDAPLFFANVGDLRRRAVMVVDQENAAYPRSPARWFVLNVEANVEVDLTAADGLAELQKDLAERGVRLGLARVKQDLLLPLQRCGLVEHIGTDMLFPTLPVAEQAYLAWATRNPYIPPEPLETEPAEDDDLPVWNVYRFTEEAPAEPAGPGLVANLTHAALSKAHQAAAAVTSAITSAGGGEGPTESGEPDQPDAAGLDEATAAAAPADHADAAAAAPHGVGDRAPKPKKAKAAKAKKAKATQPVATEDAAPGPADESVTTDAADHSAVGADTADTADTADAANTADTADLADPADPADPDALEGSAGDAASRAREGGIPTE